MLSRSTPSYLLETYTENLDKSTFINKSIDSYDKDSMNLHPHQPIYDMARNAVQEGEYAVAQISETQIKESSVEFLGNIDHEDLDNIAVSSDSDEDITLRQQKMKVLFETPFDHYFSSLSRISAEHDYEMLSRSPNKSISKIGQKGAKKSLDELTEMSFLSIFNESVIKSPDSVDKSSTHYIRLQAAVQAEMELLQTTVEEDSLELYCYLNTIAYEVMRSIDGSINEGPFEETHPIYAIIESQVQVYKKLIKRHERYYRDQNLGFADILGSKKKTQGGPLFRNYSGFEHPDPRISALITCRTLLFATTTRHLRQTEWLDDETVIPHAISHHWTNLVKFSSNHAPRSSAILIAQRYFEMIAHHSVKDDIGIHTGGNIMLLVGNADFEILEEAFQQIYNPGEREYDLLNYNSYRGLGRFIVWSGIPNEDYSDEFLEVIRNMHIRAKYYYYNDLKRETQQAMNAYESRKRKGNRLPHPSEYRRQMSSEASE